MLSLADTYGFRPTFDLKTSLIVFTASEQLSLLRTVLARSEMLKLG